MGINVTVFGKTELIDRMNAVRPKVVGAMQNEMQTQMTRLADYIKDNKLSDGDPLHRRTGALSRSVQGTSSVNGTRVTGTIGSKGVKYARVHELGGTFQIPSFERLQTVVFGRPMLNPRSVTVSAHTATYPQRAFLKPSLDQFADQIREALRQRVLGVLRDTAT